MCFTGPMWGGWGMPWLMLLVPILMMVFMFLACRFFMPRFAGWSGDRSMPGGWCGFRPMTGDLRDDEVRNLRREVEELRKELKDSTDLKR